GAFGGLGTFWGGGLSATGTMGRRRILHAASGGPPSIDFALFSKTDAPWPDVAFDDEVEAKLIERLVARDERAFNELVQAYGRRISALVLRMLGNRAEAEDLTQEVFVQVFKAI